MCFLSEVKIHAIVLSLPSPPISQTSGWVSSFGCNPALLFNLVSKLYSLAQAAQEAWGI